MSKFSEDIIISPLHAFISSGDLQKNARHYILETDFFKRFSEWCKIYTIPANLQALSKCPDHVQYILASHGLFRNYSTKLYCRQMVTANFIFGIGNASYLSFPVKHIG